MEIKRLAQVRFDSTGHQAAYSIKRGIAVSRYGDGPRSNSAKAPAGVQLSLGRVIGVRNRKAWSMTEKIEHELLSRRKAFSLLGTTAAFGLVLPVTLSALSDAEAQTPGMERRQERREGRHERREDRREGRQERREDRREGRYERREDRRGGGSKPESTGSGSGTK